MRWTVWSLDGAGRDVDLGTVRAPSAQVAQALAEARAQERGFDPSGTIAAME